MLFEELGRELGRASFSGSWFVVTAACVCSAGFSVTLPLLGPQQGLVDGFLKSRVDGSALEGLHLLGFDGMVSQLALLCGPVHAGSRLKLWARLSQLFKERG